MKHVIYLCLTFFTATLTLPALAANDRFGDLMMERMDTNGDGSISLEEFHPPRMDRHNMADTDGDGAVTLEEFAAMHDARMQAREAEHAARKAEHQTRMKERFSSMDTDGDGAVTADETKSYAFSHMDRNHDGVLSRDELKRPHRNNEHGEGHRGGPHKERDA